MNAINILGIVGIIAAFILLTILIMKGLNIFLTVFISCGCSYNTYAYLWSLQNKFYGWF